MNYVAASNFSELKKTLFQNVNLGVQAIFDGALESEEVVMFSAQTEALVHAQKTEYYNMADSCDPVTEDATDEWFPQVGNKEQATYTKPAKGHKRKSKKKH